MTSTESLSVSQLLAGHRWTTSPLQVCTAGDDDDDDDGGDGGDDDDDDDGDDGGDDDDDGGHYPGQPD